jgi:hypothetical protein
MKSESLSIAVVAHVPDPKLLITSFNLAVNCWELLNSNDTLQKGVS